MQTGEFFLTFTFNIHVLNATNKELSLYLFQFGLVYGISTIIDHFMPNSFNKYMLDMWFQDIFC